MIIFLAGLVATLLVWVPNGKSADLKFTKQRAYLRSEFDLVDGSLCYSIINKSNCIGSGGFLKGEIKTVGAHQESTDEVTIELIVRPQPDEIKIIIIPGKSIPKSGNFLITLKADYTIVVTSYERKFK